MTEQPPPPETPADDLHQDPGVPGGPPDPEPAEEEGSLEHPDSPDDPRGIDAPGSPHVAPPQH